MPLLLGDVHQNNRRKPIRSQSVYDVGDHEIHIGDTRVPFGIAPDGAVTIALTEVRSGHNRVVVFEANKGKLLTVAKLLKEGVTAVSIPPKEGREAVRISFGGRNLGRRDSLRFRERLI